MNLYTGQFVSDIDGDDIPDIVNIHGGDPFGEPGWMASFRNVPKISTGFYRICIPGPDSIKH